MARTYRKTRYRDREIPFTTRAPKRGSRQKVKDQIHADLEENDFLYSDEEDRYYRNMRHDRNESDDIMWRNKEDEDKDYQKTD